MDNQPATNSSQSRLIRLWPWLVVLAVLLFIGFIRLRLLEMPLERDEGEYAYAGQLILQGIPPYELAYNMKLPGTYFAYALGMAVFGQTISGIHLTLLVANMLTIIFVFLLGRKLFGTTAGLVACVTYGTISISPAVLGMAAHANNFVVLFAVPATLLLWKTGESDRRGILFLSGLLYGLAFLMKQQGICFCLFGWALLARFETQKKPVQWISLAKKGFTFGLGMILPFGITCVFLVCAGVFSKFWFWTFTYASSYVTGEPFSGGMVLLFTYLHQKFVIYFGFLVLAVVGLLFTLRSQTIQKQKEFIMSFFFFSFLGTATGLYFREHYFILLLPAFSIIVGLAVCSLQQVLRPRILKISVLVLFAAVVGWDISVSKDLFFKLSPVQVCQVIYQNNPFYESLAISKYIREHSAKDSRIAVIGSEPQIYFYSQRHSATGYIYTYALMEPQPYALKMQHEMIQEIESNKPEYMVFVVCRFSWLLKDTSNMTILQWFDKYSKDFYEVVGIVQIAPAGEATYLWNDAAKNYHGPLDQCLVIYKRKSTLEIVPTKSN